MTKRITQLTALTGLDPSDVIPVVDISTSQTKKVTVSEFKKNIYAFSVLRNAAANSGNGAFAKVAFDTETYDDNNNFDAVTNNRYVAPVDGIYVFNSRVSFTTTSTNQFGMIAIYKNGVEFFRGLRWLCPISAVVVSSNLSKEMKLTAGDYVEIFAFASVTLALEVSPAGVAQPVFDGHLVATL